MFSNTATALIYKPRLESPGQGEECIGMDLQKSLITEGSIYQKVKMYLMMKLWNESVKSRRGRFSCSVPCAGT